MITDFDRVLLDILADYLAATVPGIVEDLAAHDREHLAYVSLSIGVQFALELSQLDLGVAQALITAIHERDRDGAVEHNSQAQIFLDLVRRAV